MKLNQSFELNADLDTPSLIFNPTTRCCGKLIMQPLLYTCNAVKCTQCVYGSEQFHRSVRAHFPRSAPLEPPTCPLCVKNQPSSSKSISYFIWFATGSIIMAALHWLDLLEKEFDKSFVDLDLVLGEVDPEQCDLTYEGRAKMTSMSSAFAQLCHKAQTIFQNNAKLEVG